MSKFWLAVVIIVALFVGTVFYKKHQANSKHVKKSSSTEKIIMDKQSGIKYEVLKEPAVGAVNTKNGDTVIVHYTGWLNKDGGRGDRFDSSYDREKPFEFKLGAGQVIKGWDEAVSKMKVGERRLVFLPASMAYGAAGIPGVIPANADLIFDIEVVGVK